MSTPSLQTLKRDLEDISWDILDKADAARDEGRDDLAQLLYEAEDLTSDAIAVIVEAARAS